jgi:Flp pilus assembly pilin Flp
MASLKRFIQDDRGLETVEWAVIAALIVAGIITVISTLSQNVTGRFSAMESATR